MNRRFTEEQILSFLCEADIGVPVRELCSKHGFSERSYYQWRSRIVGGRISVAQQLANLRSENDQLRQLLADDLRESEPLDWPELVPLPDWPSSDMPEDGLARKSGWDWTTAQQKETSVGREFELSD